MTAFDSLDSWFEKGFKVRRTAVIRAKKSSSRDARRGSSGGGSSSGGLSNRGGYAPKSSSKAANVKAVLKKSPEVMVKITGSSSGTKSLKSHLEYISRNGQVELADESGMSINNIQGVRGIVEQNKAAGMPAESTRKEFLHVMFSMPKGTDGSALKAAVAGFCEKEFSNRRYTIALHDDTEHTHAHVCVGTQDIDRADEPRLSPRKNDIFRWRQGFAEQLREQGVDAAASYRTHRSQYRKAEHGAIRQIRAENPNSSVYNKARAAARRQDGLGRQQTAQQAPRTPKVLQAMGGELSAALAAKKRPTNPAETNITLARAAAFEKWQAVASALYADGDKEYAPLAQKMAEKATIPPSSRIQELYDKAANRGKEKDNSNEL